MSVQRERFLPHTVRTKATWTAIDKGSPREKEVEERYD